MSVQQFDYTKISELPSTSSISNNDVIIINHNGVTSKISASDLLIWINNNVTVDLTSLTNRVAALEGSMTTLSATVGDNSGTINNIISAGPGLLGIDVSS